ncbi:MAG: twin-arginine translocase TatA/TatE family subunit [Pedobacter sp.]
MYSGTLVEFLNMGGGEIMLILVAVLLLFGGKKLPELARGLGKGIRDFKDASEGVKREIHRNINSSGIVDEVDSIMNDNNTSSRYHPTEPTISETAAPAKGGISFEKSEAIAQNAPTENSRIETDKTNL